MKRILIVFIFLFVISGCTESEPHLSTDISTETNDNIRESDLGIYVDDISYELGEQVDKELGYDYKVNVIIKVREAFDNLNKREKLGMLGSFYNNYLQGDYVDCGKPDCEIRGIILKSSNNEYSLVEEEGKGFPSLLTNGTDKYTWDQLRTENGKIRDAKEAAKNKSAPKINGVSSDIIYEYMKAAYDDITNYGASYVPEVHDPMVAELAAKKFGITKEKANQIYIEKEMESY